MPTHARLALVAGLLLASSLSASEVFPIRISLLNSSKHAIREVYVSPKGSAKWGPNLGPRKAGSAPAQPRIRPGERYGISLSGECGVFDVRLVADGGTEFLEDEVDLCDDVVLTVTDLALGFAKGGRQ